MSIQRVIVELSPSRVEVTSLRGAAIGDWRCERVDRSEWPVPYTTALPDCVNTITKLLTEMGIVKATATVVYAATGSVTGLTSCAASINAGGAEQASLLALANVADFPIEDCPSDTCTLFVDKATKAVGDAPAIAAQRHILACAEAEQRALAICEALTGAGLIVDRMIPADAVAAADAIRLATTARSLDEICAVVWIGEHSTNLAVGSPGRLMFARTTSTGTEALAEVLCRPLRARDPEAPPVTLAYDAARAMLLTVGVPMADATIPGHPTLAGSALLPHLQPILQRLSIEIKQSLRFGVAEADRPRIRLRLAGPGAAVPGLGEAIARASGFVFESEMNDAHAPDALDSSTGGLLAALVRCPNLTISLLPSEARQARKVRRARKALAIGAALALAYVGFETFDSYRKLGAEQDRLTKINAAFQSSEGPMAVRQQVMADRAALTDAERRLRKALDQTPDWSTILEAMAETTPPEVRLETLDMIRDAGKGTMHVRGHIRFEEARDPATTIHTYVSKLEQVPLIESVRLGATQRAALAGHDSQTFDLTMSAFALPPASGTTATAGAHSQEGK